MKIAQHHRPFGIPLRDGISNGLVLIPKGRSMRCNAVHRPHHPAQMHPVPMRTFLDQWIAGSHVDGVVECQIRVNDGAKVRSLSNTPAMLKDRGINDAPGLGRQLGGQRVQGTSDFIKVGDPRYIELCNLDSATRCILDEAIFFQKPQRLQNRRSRDTQLFSNLLLSDAFPRCQRSIGDGIHQDTVRGLNKVRASGNSRRIEFHTNIVFWIQSTR